jgi:hypothetical protein
VSTFYDEYQQSELWGADLAVHLEEVFGRGARFVIPFISAEYETKVWPRHEFRSALATAVATTTAYLLPVRFDHTELPGLRSTIGYVDAHKVTPAELAELVLEKLGRAAPIAEPATPATPATAPTGLALPRMVPPDFNPYAEAERIFARLRAGLSERAGKLSQVGLIGHSADRDGRFKLRVLRAGDVLFTLDIWLGGNGFGGDDTLSFHHGWHENMTPGAVTGTGQVVWSKERGAVAVDLTSFSLIRGTAGTFLLSPDDLLEALWNTIVEHLNSSGR